MIKLFDDYVILVDSRNFTVAKTLKFMNKKTGKEEVKYSALGYYSSLLKALEGLGGIIANQELQKGERSLTEAVECIRESNQRVHDVYLRIAEGLEGRKK